MDTDDTRQVEAPNPDLTTALLDLARLAQRVGVAAVEGPGEVAISLLERVMTLCGAERGAILLPRANPTLSEQTFGTTLPNVRRFRVLTRLGVSEEDVLALSMEFSVLDADIQVPAGEPSWLLGRLAPVPVTLQEDRRNGTMAADSLDHARLPGHALLLLGWSGTDGGTYPPAVQKGIALLPNILDAVGSVVVNIQLAERVSELETVTKRKALYEMDLLKAELLATVSHELRSPLASIKGYAATLLRHERRISREERHEFLVAINEASDRLALLIDRLLEMSQLETGTITIERTSVNLVDLAREAVMAAEQRLETSRQVEEITGTNKHVTFALHVEDRNGTLTRGEVCIQADRYRLREVLDHLLENAVNYSPTEGTIEVTIRPLGTLRSVEKRRIAADNVDDSASRNAASRSKYRDQQVVEISVRDHGQGIPSEHLERVFDRFHRVDTGLTREVNGLGLGLAICKSIVELHEGKIWAESSVGEGSTFSIWLPVDSGMSPHHS
ncbi:MAG: sensor histidine kinase [Ktedonobacteraceae bacterium]